LATYYANIGPARGLFLYCEAIAAIGVLDAPDQHLPIGVALPARRHPSGAALWRLEVHGAELPGLWVIRDRRFKPAGECRAQHNAPVLLPWIAGADASLVRGQGGAASAGPSSSRHNNGPPGECQGRGV
jgi:hypothetical protein